MKGAAEGGASCPRKDDQELGREAVSPLTEMMCRCAARKNGRLPEG